MRSRPGYSRSSRRNAIIERRRLDVRGVPVEVIRKNIEHLYVGVHPPDGQVRVSAPLRFDEDAIRLAVVSRLGWIRRQQARFARQEPQSERELVTGESHWFEGRRYRLDVIEQAGGPPDVRLRGNTTLELRVRPGAGRDARAAVLDRWYRDRLEERLPALTAEWEPRIGVAVRELRIRKMKTRWGSCNMAARRIWLNLDLARKPVSCLEYVLVHEMVHFHERLHNRRFYGLMDRFLPGWRLRRDELNRTPPAHEPRPS